jgi:hypothetical protein
MLVLQQDNKEKIKIIISKQDLAKEVKKLMGWRKSKETVLKRFYSLGSKDYDNIIKQLSLKGY